MQKDWQSWAASWQKRVPRIKVWFPYCYTFVISSLQNIIVLLNATLVAIIGSNGSGGVNEAWRFVGEEMEAGAEAHRLWGIALSEQLAKPLRVSQFFSYFFHYYTPHYTNPKTLFTLHALLFACIEKFHSSWKIIIIKKKNSPVLT